MMRAYHLVLSFSLLVCFIDGTKFLKSAEQEYGYIEVRPGAHLFWWLQYAGGKVAGATDKPLLLWIQGGPGFAASGVGNFLEFGPLDADLRKRNFSWVNKRNILLVDSPIGTGFSYSEKKDLCRTDKKVATDLVKFVKKFLEKHPEFKRTPFHIFSQSYGAKIAAHLAVRLHKEKQKQRIDINLQTVGLGSAWVSPRESMKAVPGLLYHMGYMDTRQYKTMQKEVDETMKFLDNKLYNQAMKKWTKLDYENISARVINNYNILKKSYDEELEKLNYLMNFVVRPVLGSTIPKHVLWNFFNETVWDALYSEFLKPATHLVEILLEQTDFNIVVYNGNMDVATPLTGAENWVNKLKWYGAEEFKEAKRVPLNGFQNGYVRRHSRLHLWSILNAGHWIPTDNPAAMHQLLDYFAAVPETTTESYVEPVADNDTLQDEMGLVSTTTDLTEEYVDYTVP